MGREKEIINVGGLKVAPGEIEKVLLEYSGVIEAGVIGIPADDINLEAILAFIVISNTEFNIQNLTNHCKDNLEPYKMPKKISVVKSLPKTSSGKLQRHLINKLLVNKK